MLELPGTQVVPLDELLEEAVLRNVSALLVGALGEGVAEGGVGLYEGIAQGQQGCGPQVVIDARPQ